MENNIEAPGIKGKKFKLKLDRAWFMGDTIIYKPKKQPFYLRLDMNYFKKGDVLTADWIENTNILVISEPRTQWYWKVLHYLTFKLLFKPRDTYKCELIN